MKKLILLISLFFIISIGIVNATSVGYEDSDFTKGRVVFTPESIKGITNTTTINTNHSNSTDNWITSSDGSLSDINTTQTENSDGVLNILESWLDGLDLWGAIYAGIEWAYNQTEAVYSEPQLNETIDQRTASFYYNATQIETIEGTYVIGNITSLWVPEDVGNNATYNVTEDVGANPSLININFTNIVDFETIVGRIYYKGGQGHEVQAEMYRFDTNTWENQEEYTDMTDFVNIHFFVNNPANYIDSTGNVSFRFRHAQNGLPGHVFYIDYLNLVDGWTAITTADHDGLGGRDNKENHPWAMPRDGTKNFTGNITILGNFLSNGTDWFSFGDLNRTGGVGTSGIWENLSGVATYTGDVNITGDLNVTGNLTAESLRILSGDDTAIWKEDLETFWPFRFGGIYSLYGYMFNVGTSKHEWYSGNNSGLPTFAFDGADSLETIIDFDFGSNYTDSTTIKMSFRGVDNDGRFDWIGVSNWFRFYDNVNFDGWINTISINSTEYCDSGGCYNLTEINNSLGSGVSNINGTNIELLNLFMGDNNKTYFGDADDVSFSFDGNDLNVTAEVGTPSFNLDFVKFVFDKIFEISSNVNNHITFENIYENADIIFTLNDDGVSQSFFHLDASESIAYFFPSAGGGNKVYMGSDLQVDYNANINGFINTTSINITGKSINYELFSNDTSMYVNNGSDIWDLLYSNVPKGGIINFDLTSCPNGWEEEVVSYDTGWLATSDWTNVHLGSVNGSDSEIIHNLDTNLSELIVKVMISTDGTDANSRSTDWDAFNADTSTEYGFNIFHVNSSAIQVQTGVGGLGTMDGNGNSGAIDTEAWFYRIVVEKTSNFPTGITCEKVRESTTQDDTLFVESDGIIKPANSSHNLETEGNLTFGESIFGFQKARSYRNASQTLSAGVFDKIDIDTDSFDIDTITDLTNSRITPTKAGYYQVNGQIRVNTVANDVTIVSIYKNGAEVSRGTRTDPCGNIVSEVVSDLIYLDGVDDYIELWAYCSAARPLLVTSTKFNYISVVGPF